MSRRCLDVLCAFHSSNAWMRAGFAAFALAASMLGLPARAYGQAWNIQWSDEFDGKANTAPDSANWTYDTGGGGWGNGELEIYCAPFSAAPPCDPGEPNIYQDGHGNLVIRAIHNNGTWTSGRMKTAGKHVFQYGRVEARLKLQSGAGFWPAFWMLGTTVGSVGWPEAGEQEIMEWAQRYGVHSTSSTIHGPGYSGGRGITTENTFPNGGRIDDGYHLYGVVWSPDQLQFYRDNPARPFVTLTPSRLPAGSHWVFNRPFFVLLNFAVGHGSLPGYTDASTPNTGTMLVDYVRVYEPSNTLHSDAWYTVANQNSGACLDGANGGGSDGSVMQQWPCSGAQLNQQWQFTPVEGGYYKVTARSAPVAWNVSGGPGATSNGARLQLWSYRGGGNQQWKPISLGNGSYRFIARSSGMCLDVPGASQQRGVQLQQAVCTGSAAQAWVLSQQP